jgi:hypothetical protein
MNPELENLDLHTLKSKYDKEVELLNTQLLKGAEWTAVADQRKKVTDLAIAVHRKIASTKLNPAEHSSGEMEGRN